jgi:hypothetical protein
MFANVLTLQPRSRSITNVSCTNDRRRVLRVPIAARLDPATIGGLERRQRTDDHSLRARRTAYSRDMAQSTGRVGGGIQRWSLKRSAEPPADLEPNVGNGWKAHLANISLVT